MRPIDGEVVAILLSDIHLSIRPPRARAGEPNWLAAMARPLKEVSLLAEEKECPVICAGDIFDKWNSPPELINFAMKALPFMWAVPGQHDLPHHLYDKREKSAYWTLVEADVVKNLHPETAQVVLVRDDYVLHLHGFPWGYPVEHPQTFDYEDRTVFRVAVVHEYLWMKGHCYPGAPEENNVTGRKDFKGYDVAVFGDNHKGFLTNRGKCQILNCGGFMRRNSDQQDYQPCIGILRPDGSVERIALDITADVLNHTQSTVPEVGPDQELTRFVEELEEFGGTVLDFPEAMKQALDRLKPDEQVREIIAEAMGQ
jgi:hypothetical protein